MIDDREIWACANQVLRQYGDAAWYHASQRADELFAAGDHEGHRTWVRILRRIEALERLTPDSTIQ
jgi:hypothetical protein